MTHDELADRLEALAEDMGADKWAKVRLYELAAEARALGQQRGLWHLAMGTYGDAPCDCSLGRNHARQEGHPPREVDVA